MKGIKYILAFLMTMSAILAGSLQVSADDSGIPFRADLILPESQDEDIEDYVSITTNKDSVSEQLEFSLVNNEDEDKEIIVEVVDSYTSPGGIIQYSAEGPEDSEITDENYKMSKYVSLEEDAIKLKAGETKNIKLDLDINNLDGVILGGVSFKEKAEEKVDNENNDSKDSDFTIESEINIIIGIKVDFGTEQLVEMNIGDPFVEAMPALHIVRLPMELKNTAPKKFNFDYKVEKDGMTMFEDDMNIDFASKSKAHIRLPWRADSIENGATYVLKGTLTYKDLDGENKSIDVNKSFEYKTKSYTQTIENIFSPKEENGNNNYLFWVLGLVAIVLLILTLVIREGRKNYSYYSDDKNAPEFIVKGNELYSEMTKDKSNAKGNKYRHVYKREKKNKGDYELIKTKDLR